MNSATDLSSKKMKMKITVTIVLLLTGISTVSFGQNSIEGSWILDVEESIQRMEQGVRLKYDSLPEHVKARAKDTMRDREFKFEKNGRVIVNWRIKDAAQQSAGRWKIDSQYKKLTLLIDGASFDYSYEHPTGNTLVLKSEESGGYFDILYFNKSVN
jgi:hypothetical protein